ncbi:MAG: hypothetical protein CVV37_02075 [Nitrospira bacterium HGW-Nitrospira-1]|nr:MAG: hypothetical protein CVV37_02075 [Nitrospira bacterium HGW-Nitrospira-1]
MIFLLWFFPPPVPPTLLKRTISRTVAGVCIYFFLKRVFQEEKINIVNLFLQGLCYDNTLK